MPTDPDSRKRSGNVLSWVGVFACLGASAVATVLAPLLMPDSYSWIRHTVSRSGAQGVDGAWLARLGFVLFGLGVIWMAALSARRWGRWATAAHACFGVAMIAAAAFSSSARQAGMAHDSTEDRLHVFAAGMTAISFMLGVLAVHLRRRQVHVAVQLFDFIAIAATAFASFAIVHLGNIDGVLQRIMLVIAYLWYTTEAMRVSRDEHL